MTTRPSLQFLGAAGEVTGSCTLLTTPRARVLIDFGLFQGSAAQEQRNALPPDIDFESIDAVVVTHAHVDHCGRLGMLPALGCECGIWCTEPTSELLPRILRSSAGLQRMRSEEYDKGTLPDARVLAPGPLVPVAVERGLAPPILYTEREAKATARCLRAVGYGEWAEIADGVRLRLHDASHVIGSASVELECEFIPGRPRVLLSGDIGPASGRLLAPHGGRGLKADVVVMESTNGGRGGASEVATAGSAASASTSAKARVPGAREVKHSTLESVLRRAMAEGRQLLFPVFALGRAQVLLRRFAEMARSGELDNFPVFVDSAMAVRACMVCNRHPTLLHRDAAHEIANGTNPLAFGSAQMFTSAKSAAAIADESNACAILAGSGFCDAGPVLRHLRRLIVREDASIVLAGHQIDGSLAQGLAAGASRIHINGEDLEVRAEVVMVDGLSGHASSKDLLEWLGQRVRRGSSVILNHGAAQARTALAAAIGAQCGEITCPQMGDRFDF